MNPFAVTHRVAVTGDALARVRTACVLTGDTFPFGPELYDRYTFEGTRSSDLVLHMPYHDVDCALHVASWTTGRAPKPCLNFIAGYDPALPPADIVIERARGTMGVTLLVGNRYLWSRVLDVLPRLRDGGLEKTINRVRAKFYAFLRDDEVADVVAEFPLKYAHLRTEAEGNRAASKTLDLRAHGLGWRRVKVDGVEVWKKKEFSS